NAPKGAVLDSSGVHARLFASFPFFCNGRSAPRLEPQPRLFGPCSAIATRCMSDSDEKVWQTTAVQNLVRYAPSGTYFARFRVGGRLVWKSLKTATFSVAKQRLPDTLRDHRSKIESLTAFTEGKMTVGNAADVYLQKVRANISLKPRSKDYRELMIDFIRRSWPSLFETDVRKVSPRDCELWLSRY